tara:strand:+ start:778 stop:984 length:207 start_codon:yes stop_codon:yes gene_type:complete
MKALLIVAALNMQLVYDDMAVCKQAQSELMSNNIESICIPKGEDVKTHDMMSAFIDMVQQLETINKEQ